MNQRRFIFIFLAGAVTVGLFFYASFFRAVASTTSEWTGSGFVWPYQLFHNFLHGRPFQSSLFARDIGMSVGFIGNPYGFINANVIHVNWTPYLFAPLWGLRQTPGWFYGIQVLWCLVFSGFFTAAILRRLDPVGWRRKTALALAVLVSSGLLSIINQMGQLLVFAGPLMLAVYHAALTRRRGWFYLGFAALCFVSEDAAMVGLMFGLYFALFEPENRREGVWAAAGAFIYLAFVLGVLQPAARAELTVVSSSTTTAVIAHVLDLKIRPLLQNLYSLLPALTLLPALGLAAALFGVPSDRSGRIRLIALALVPASLHWGESVVVGGAHHLSPPFFGLYLALVVLIGSGKGRDFRLRVVVGWACVYALVTLRALAGNMPPEIKLPLLRRLRPAQAEGLARSLSLEKESNLAVIAAGRSIPVSESLCYLGNNRAEGYLSARSDIWVFPDHYADARYFLLQKDANDLNIAVVFKAGETLDALAARTQWDNVQESALTPEVSALIRRTLVDEKRTHRVVRDDAHVLLLENLHPNTPVSAPTTYGFGWVANIGRRPVRVARPN